MPKKWEEMTTEEKTLTGKVYEMLAEYKKQNTEQEEVKKDKGAEDPILTDSMKKLETEIDPMEEKLQKILNPIADKMTAIEAKFAEYENQVATPAPPVFSAKASKPGGAVQGVRTGMNDSENKFSIVKAIRGIKFGNWKNAEFEKKTLIADTGTGGIYIIPTETASRIIGLVYAQTVINKLPVNINNPTGNPFEIPKISTGATAYWIDETTAITKSSPTIGQLQLTPHDCAALVPVSNRTITQSDPAADSIIERNIASQLALAFDLAYLQGSGSANQPTGILNTGSIQEVVAGASAGTAGVISGDKLFDFVYAIEAANGVFQGWAMNPRTKWELRKLTDSNGDYIMDENIWKNEQPQLIGFPYVWTTQIPIDLTVGGDNDCTYILGGQWSTVELAQWGGVGIDASTEASYVHSATTYSAFQLNQTLIRGIGSVDIGLGQPAVMGKLTEIKAA